MTAKNMKVEITLEDLKIKVRNLKEEVKEGKEVIESGETSNEDDSDINIISKVNYHKWYAYITLVVKDFKITLRTLLDSGADHNCIREGLIPTKYFEKTKEKLRAANKQKLEVNYKLSKAHVCVRPICFENTFLLVKTLSQDMILGTPFISQLYPFVATKNDLTSKIFGKEKNKILTKNQRYYKNNRTMTFIRYDPKTTSYKSRIPEEGDTKGTKKDSQRNQKIHQRSSKLFLKMRATEVLVAEPSLVQESGGSTVVPVVRRGEDAQ